jgi:hypothetical protein
VWELCGKPQRVLHPFGGLAEIGDTVDLNETTAPTWVGDAHDMHWIEDESYDLVVIDPPYSADESDLLYGGDGIEWGLTPIQEGRAPRGRRRLAPARAPATRRARSDLRPLPRPP